MPAFECVNLSDRRWDEGRDGADTLDAARGALGRMAAPFPDAAASPCKAMPPQRKHIDLEST
jgi:hypothetical protein